MCRSSIDHVYPFAATVAPVDRLKTIQVKVKPSARTSALDELPDGTWVAQLKSPPIDGKANEELIALIAKRFRCRKANVAIGSGAGARLKLVRIAIG